MMGIKEDAKAEKECCTVCCRLHEETQPCSVRVAHAYFEHPQAWEQLTTADRQWMQDNTVSFFVIFEEELADRMGR